MKQIIDASGGSILVHSKGLGQGSYFCFSMKMEGFMTIDEAEKVDHPPPAAPVNNVGN